MTEPVNERQRPEQIARQSLAQVERWQPSTDRDRRMKALNIAQLRAYLQRFHPAGKS